MHHLPPDDRTPDSLAFKVTNWIEIKATGRGVPVAFGLAILVLVAVVLLRIV